ncbi:MAG: hypothetical protein ACLFO3_06340 [Candidatus Acetothermia bacterium]
MVEESGELALRNEIELYEPKKEDWVDEYGEGKFVAIQGDAVLDLTILRRKPMRKV